MATDVKKKKLHYAWFILIGVVAMMGMCRGGMNGNLGLFYQPISADMGWGLGEISLMSSVSALVTMFFSPFAGRILDKYDIRIITAVAVTVMSAMFVALSTVQQVWGLYAFFAVYALGASFATQLVGPKMINLWFKDNNGLAMGVMMCAVALFTAILAPITSSLIASNGWRAGYIFLGILTFAIVVPAVILVFRTPQKKGLLPFGASEADIAQASSASILSAGLPGLTSKQALKTSTFWLFFLFMTLITGTLAFTQMVPTLAIEAGFDGQVAGYALTAFSLGSAISAVGFGSIADKIGPMKASMAALACGIVAFALLLTFRTNLYAFFTALFLFGCTAPTLGTLGPLILGTLFGQKEFASIYGIVMMATGLGSMILIPAYGFVYDFTASFQPVLILMIIFLATCLFCITMAFKTGRKVQESWVPKA